MPVPTFDPDLDCPNCEGWGYGRFSPRHPEEDSVICPVCHGSGRKAPAALPEED